MVRRTKDKCVLRPTASGHTFATLVKDQPVKNARYRRFTRRNPSWHETIAVTPQEASAMNTREQESRAALAQPPDTSEFLEDLRSRLQKCNPVKQKGLIKALQKEIDQELAAIRRRATPGSYTVFRVVKRPPPKPRPAPVPRESIPVAKRTYEYVAGADHVCAVDPCVFCEWLEKYGR
jgi:putative component of membrane protein insertase Oxa1/YidC/SpoIIIJ protein YidD